MKHYQYVRSAIALLLLMSCLLSLAPTAFATETETEDSEQTIVDVGQIAEDAELDPDDENYEDQLLQALRDAYGLTPPEEEEDSEFGYLTYDELIEAGLDPADYGLKGNTKDVRNEEGFAYIFLDFKVASSSRNANWQVQSDSTSDQYFAANMQGLLAGYYQGDNSQLYMPIETHDSGLTRLNSYKIKKGDIALVHIYETTANTIFKSGNTKTIPTYFAVRTSDNKAGWSKFGANRTLKLDTAAQTIQWTAYNDTSSGGENRVGDTLYGIRWDPIQPSDADKGKFSEASRIYLDYIYIGPTSTKPVMVEFVNESGSLLSQGRGYVGYGKKAPAWSTGKVDSDGTNTRTIYGWQLYVKDSSGNWVDQKKFISNPATVTCKADTRFKLTAVTLPKVTKNNSVQTYNTGISDADDKYLVSCNTYDIASASVASYATPLDVCIVLDRSASQAEFVGSGKALTSESAMNTYLDSLNKRYWPGYYRATVWRRNNSMTDNPKGADYQMFFPMRYYRGAWQMQIITKDCECNGTKYRNYGVVPWNSTGMKQCSHVQWVSMSTGFQRYKALCEAQGYSLSSVPFKIGACRMGKEQSAVEQFMRELYASIPNLKPGQTHNFSVLAYNQTVLVTNYPYGDEISEFKKNNMNVSEAVTKFDHTTYEKFLKCIRHTYVYGATRTDCAMMVLSGEVSTLEEEAGKTSATLTKTDYLPAAASGRKRVVILLTDGVPTATKAFNNSLATDAIDASRRLKANANTTVYVIAVMAGLNADTKYASSYVSGTEAQRANNFMNLVSSNYKSAKAYNAPETGTTAYSAGHYFSGGEGGDEIGDAFTAIWKKQNSSLTPGSSFTGPGSLWLYEEFGREWKLDPADSIKVYAAPHTGDVKFGSRVLLGEHKVTDITTKQTITGKGYTLYVEPKGEGFTVTLKWTDAKTAYIRNTALSTDMKASATGLTTNKGYQISMDIPVEVNKENTMGGNNIPLTVKGSGEYIAASGDASKEASPTFAYTQPNANVSYSTTTKAYDYFIPRDEYIALHNGTSDAGKFGTLMENMVFVDAEMDFTNSAGKSRIDYLNIDVNVQSASGSVIYNKKAAATKTAFTNTCNLANAKANLLNDTVLTLRTTMAPRYNATDSFNRAPYPTVTLDANPVYYVPKFAVVDYGDDIHAALGGLEGADPTKISGYSAGTFDAATSSMIYHFDDKMFQTTDKTIPYKFTCANTPKNATSNIVDRFLTVIPGNVMTYDQTMITFAKAGNVDTIQQTFKSSVTGKNKERTVINNRVGWTTVGTTKDIVQTFNNSSSHGGYDGQYTTTGDFHGSVMKATVSGDVHEYDSDGEIIKTTANSTAQAQFTFKGTGFEVLSRTTKDSGVLLAEVFAGTSIGANAKPVKSILCNTYLATADYVQAPVIRWTGAYGDYTVRLTAYYNIAFAYRSTRNAVTEAEAKAILGYDDSIDFTYIDSKGMGAAERGIAASYNVYVDGIRVFNPLNEGDSVSQYVYSLAKEGYANFGDIQNIVLDSSNWKGGQATGMLFLADRNSEIGSNTGAEQFNNDLAFPLFMDATLDYEKVGEKTYFKDRSGKRINDPKTGLPIYSIYVDGAYKYRVDKASGNKSYTELSREYVRSVLVSYSGYFYNTVYRSYGAKNEVQLKTGQGVAFTTDADSLHLSLKSADGKATKVMVWNGSKWINFKDPGSGVTLSNLKSTTEMFYDFTAYKGTVIIRNDGEGILSICQVKAIGAPGSKSIQVDNKLAIAAMAAFEGEEPTITLEDVKISHSLNLQSNISVNYIVAKSAVADFDDYLLTAEVNGASYAIFGVEKGELVYFTLDCLTAAQMNENITAQLKCYKDGKIFVSPEDHYSIAAYAYTMMNKDGVSESLKSLCANLLRYGAATQVFLGKTESGLADEEMTDEQRALLTDLEAVEFGNNYAVMDDLPEATVAWVGKSLALDSTVAVKLIVNASAFAGDPAELELRVSYTDINGESKELTINPTVYNAENGLYQFTVDQLNAAELRTVLSCQVFAKGEAVSQTMTYSGDSYGNGKTGTLLELCKALFAYVDQAKAVFAG